MVRKTKQAPRRYKLGDIDSEVKRRWDHKKTLLENYALMGLKLDDKNQNQQALDKLGMECDPVKLNIPEDKGKKERGLTFYDQHYYRDLMLKYGDDYEKMKLDSKLNYLLKTAGECEKACKKFIVLYGHPLHTNITINDYENQKLKEQKEKEEKEEKEKQLQITKKQEQQQKDKQKQQQQQPNAKKQKQQQTQNQSKKSNSNTNTNNNVLNSPAPVQKKTVSPKTTLLNKKKSSSK
eukprot:gene4730-5904_t